MRKKYSIAHVHEQGEDLIIIPLNANTFNSLTRSEQESTREALQFFATDAGLVGTVCIVWQLGNLFKFIAPTPWHQYFRSIDMGFVQANLNRELSCQYS